MNTVLITGCSSGFGLETARLFLQRDWNVIATMRTPNPELLPPSERLRLLPLDVADPAGIQAAVEAAGPVDALVNNAGQGMLGLLENTDMAAIRALFETNTFGTMAMCQAVLPQLRAQGSGVIVNVTSSTTLLPLPMLSVYTASKAAVEAFTRCLALELKALGIRAQLVIPGRSPETRFGHNAQRLTENMPEAYAGFAQGVFQAMRGYAGDITHAGDVAEAVWQAVTDPATPMNLPAGADAVALAAAR